MSNPQDKSQNKSKNKSENIHVRSCSSTDGVSIQDNVKRLKTTPQKCKRCPFFLLCFLLRLVVVVVAVVVVVVVLSPFLHLLLNLFVVRTLKPRSKNNQTPENKRSAT
ncbi:hypothetical protein ASPTUDRAFT_323072 [Aspergillus tubingensis CBS 134.48]|uniref:Uncharacterized protein n=1 Tax=Aspergillus tubingensis (strain CBS 134.48) TaxID=767770 RepID=A0A1L9NJU3_ASPTC|nr:hypothetical protein ASPTUDRAFT_323072 [Aspergillus tubingensis CBS 134.48]